MEEGTPAIASEQAESPAIEQQTPVTEIKDEPIELDSPAEVAAEANTEESSTQEDEQPPAEGEEGTDKPYEPELVEIELNGKKYAVPADLKDGYLMQADYTRKTQEVAELRKSTEALKAEAETHLNTSKEVLEARAHLINLDAQLQQYQNVNWQQLENDDPVSAMSHWRQFQQLRETRSNLATQVDQFQRQVSEQAEQATVARLRETREFAEKNIPGWNDQVDKDIVNFANGLGFTTEALRGAITPQIYQTLHLAMLGHQFLQKQQAAPKPAPTNVKPLNTVSAKASPAVTTDLADMSMEQYVAARQAQMKKR